MPLTLGFNIQIHSHDYPLPKFYLDHHAMKDHHFIDAADSFNNIRYNLVCCEVTRDIIPLPAPALFDTHARNRYTVLPEAIIAYRNAQTIEDEEPQEWYAQVPPPQHFKMGPDGYYGC